MSGACSIAMCGSLAPVTVKFSFSFLFTIVVCVATKSACCALSVSPVVVPVAYGVGVTGIAGLTISISWPWVLVFCMIWAIRANVRVVLRSWEFREFEMFIRFCCTSLMTLVLSCSRSWKFTVLSVTLSAWHGCALCVVHGLKVPCRCRLHT